MNSTPTPKAIGPHNALIALADEQLAHAYEQIALADGELARLSEQLAKMERDAARPPSACVLISGQASIGPFGSPVFACAGKTDPPSLLILSQTSAGNC
jgi:hypothetical protein